MICAIDRAGGFIQDGRDETPYTWRALMARHGATVKPPIPLQAWTTAAIRINALASVIFRQRNLRIDIHTWKGRTCR